MKRKLGILGGMGPLATADLFTKIIKMTKAGCDNEHIRVFIDSNSSIPDRTAAILEGGEDPLNEMTASLHILERCGADCILIPCNTAHFYFDRLQKQTRLPILNMPEIASAQAGIRYPGKCACVLATKGTLASGVYHRALEAHQIPYVMPNESEQEILMYLVYEVVKAAKDMNSEAETWKRLLERLRNRGADYFLLACTELPILAESLEEPGPFVDPTSELAKEAIRFCGYQVKAD